MKKDHSYIEDIIAIRAMMERSSKFLTLSGWAGIMTGIYALISTYIAYRLLHFIPNTIGYSYTPISSLLALAFGLILVSLGTNIYLTVLKSKKAGIKIWSPSVKGLISDMSLPLFAGGIVLLGLVHYKLIGLLAPVSLIFYGISLTFAGNYTYKALKTLGAVQIVLGLFSFFFIEWSILCWALGFGVLHIVYGLYIHQIQLKK